MSVHVGRIFAQRGGKMHGLCRIEADNYVPGDLFELALWSLLGPPWTRKNADPPSRSQRLLAAASIFESPACSRFTIFEAIASCIFVSCSAGSLD